MSIRKDSLERKKRALSLVQNTSNKTMQILLRTAIEKSKLRVGKCLPPKGTYSAGKEPVLLLKGRSFDKQLEQGKETGLRAPRTFHSKRISCSRRLLIRS